MNAAIQPVDGAEPSESGNEPSAAANDERPRGRGGPTRAAENEFDVRLAIKEFEVAHALYLRAMRETGDITRRRLMEEARDKVRLAMAFGADVLKRPAR